MYRNSVFTKRIEIESINVKTEKNNLIIKTYVSDDKEDEQMSKQMIEYNWNKIHQEHEEKDCDFSQRMWMLMLNWLI